MRRVNVLFLSSLLLAFSAASFAQEAKPYKEGPVTQLSYIKVKPGKFDEYMSYLGGPYKAMLEAEKKAGLITGHAVYSSEARSPSDPDLILSVTYANMAALDRIDESDAIAAKVMGSRQTQSKAFADRGTMRETLGGQLVRELILK